MKEKSAKTIRDMLHAGTMTFGSDIEQIVCMHKLAAESQRVAEKERGLGDTGTKSYAEHGCYQCNGYRMYCQTYTSAYSLTQERDKRDKNV